MRYLPRLALALLALATTPATAHVVPPERLHPAAESFRRLEFLVALNPVLWTEVARDTEVLAAERERHDPAAARRLRAAAAEIFTAAAAAPDKVERRRLAGELYGLATESVAASLLERLDAARAALAEPRRAATELEEARRVFAAFEPWLAANDPEAFRRLGECWLEMADALGSAGLAGFGSRAADPAAFDAERVEIAAYLDGPLARRTRMPQRVELPAAAGAPAPLAPDWDRTLPRRLPPGANLNKQLPRPRQVLNMAARGVDESETHLIALGDMAFDSSLVFGEPARSLGLTCNTCHNKSITNPQLFIPGLSVRPGGVDVSNSFFAPHANNGHFDPLDIPDLRGIRFTGPYGRNGRFASLREFTRNVIVNEFNGAEPDPLILDGLVAYMLEFDFLPNPRLGFAGRLTDEASPAARRGEEIFHRPYAAMGQLSCASCHPPAEYFRDGRRHDIGSVEPAAAGGRDGALDTPTLLSSRYTAPYFHDGSLPSLAAVVDWFDERFGLGLTGAEKGDLTAYLETVGDGVDAYEDTVHTLAAELEEFSFFLSTYEFLRQRGKAELIDTTLGTIAYEIRAHKWDVQDRSRLPVLDRLAALMDEARAAVASDELAAADELVADYRRLYEEHREVLE